MDDALLWPDVVPVPNTSQDCIPGHDAAAPMNLDVGRPSCAMKFETALWGCRTDSSTTHIVGYRVTNTETQPTRLGTQLVPLSKRHHTTYNGEQCEHYRDRNIASTV